MGLLVQVGATNVSRADAADPNDLPAVAATWPEEWQNHLAEREAIVAIDRRQLSLRPDDTGGIQGCGEGAEATDTAPS